MTNLVRKLNAPNLNPEERERLETQIGQIMGSEFDPLESSDDLDDEDYVPEEDENVDEASDIEQEIELEAVLDDNDDDYAEELYTEAPTAIPLSSAVAPDYVAAPVQEEAYRSKDGKIWNANPPPSGRPRSHNVPTITHKGPLRGTLPHHRAIFKSLLSPEIVNIIVRETNRKALESFRLWNEAHPNKKQRVWMMTNEDEMYAFFGMLLFAGVFHANSQPAKELWASYNMPIYKATMSFNRFKHLTTYIRFDNGNTRAERLQQSKSAAIDDVWLMLMAYLERAYTPDCQVTVGEQLFPYRGRTRFTQYIPSKPAKYGIKVWWVCDSVLNYPLKGIIYTRKPPGVMKLMEKYMASGRTVYADNFFSSYNLAEMLMDRNVAFVGTVRKNKTFIPPQLLNPKRALNSTIFCFLPFPVLKYTHLICMGLGRPFTLHLPPNMPPLIGGLKSIKHICIPRQK